MFNLSTITFLFIINHITLRSFNFNLNNTKFYREYFNFKIHKFIYLLTFKKILLMFLIIN